MCISICFKAYRLLLPLLFHLLIVCNQPKILRHIKWDRYCRSIFQMFLYLQFGIVLQWPLDSFLKLNMIRIVSHLCIVLLARLTSTNFIHLFKDWHALNSHIQTLNLHFLWKLDFEYEGWWIKQPCFVHKKIF